MQVLELENNKLVEFPSCILHMTALTTLELSKNPSIRNVPQQLSSLVNLQRLAMAECANVITITV